MPSSTWQIQYYLILNDVFTLHSCTHVHMYTFLQTADCQVFVNKTYMCSFSHYCQFAVSGCLFDWQSRPLPTHRLKTVRIWPPLDSTSSWICDWHRGKKARGSRFLLRLREWIIECDELKITWVRKGGALALHTLCRSHGPADASMFTAVVCMCR